MVGVFKKLVAVNGYVLVAEAELVVRNGCVISGYSN